MKTLLMILTITLFMGLTLNMAYAEEKTATVSFDWTAPAPGDIRQPVGFRFWKDNETTPVCEITDINLRLFSCPVIFTAADLTTDKTRVEASFTMTVFDNLGGESDRSTAVVGGFPVSEVPSLNAPVLLSITIQ